MRPTSRPPVGVCHDFGCRTDDTLDEYLAVVGRQPLFELRTAATR